MDRMAGDRFVDYACRFARGPAHERQIDFFHGARGELFREIAVGRVVFCDDDSAAGFFVEPMDNPRALFPADAGKVSAMREERVDQRVLLVPRARMHHDPGGLVQHEQIVIFENNVERYLLRLRFDFLNFRLAQFDDIAGADRIARPDGLAIYLHEPLTNKPLEPGPGKCGQRLGEKAIEPLAGLNALDFELDHGCIQSRMLHCAAMPDLEPDGSSQSCPGCGLLIDVSQVEPLAKVACPQCGEKFRVERAFDNFAVLETLGVGGMGSVYKARDTRLNRFVALKLLRPELSADPAEIARLEQEARATAAVNDPHVVQVFSSGTDHGQFYLVMELVDQGSLDDRMAEQGRVNEAQVLDTGIQVARGLRAAYEKGLIHRDVKPGNILFADEATAKIGDFGLAVAAGQDAQGQNEIWGTPYYVAPERLNNEPEDFRSDLYSLGATLYHALAGRPPFEGETNSATALRDLKNDPLSLGAAAPELRRETVRTIDRMIAPDREKRFASYDELIAALEQARDALNPSGKKAKRRRLVVAAALLLAVIVAGGVYLQKQHAERLAKAKAAGKSGEETLQHLYDDARRELIAGKYDSARTTFARLAGEAQNKQPLLNWIRLHRGLANLLRGYTTQARQAFEELEKAAQFSTRSEDKALALFFNRTASTMNAPGSVPAAGQVLIEASPDAFALFLFAMKDWQQSDFADAAALLQQFQRTNSPGSYSWINDYKPLAEKFLADYRVYTDWKNESRSFTSREQITRALTALRTAQGKLQLRGRLTDAFKEEEAKLVRQLEERK